MTKGGDKDLSERRSFSINTKLISLTSKLHGGKLICDRTKLEIYKMCENQNHFIHGYLLMGAEFLYFPLRNGFKLLFTTFTRNIPTAKRLHR